MYWQLHSIDPGLRLEGRYLSVRIQYTNGKIRYFYSPTLADALRESHQAFGWKPTRITSDGVVTLHPHPPSPREIFNSKWTWKHPKDLVDYLEEAQ